MEKLNVMEFRSFCESLPSCTYLYDTNNQEDGEFKNLKITYRCKDVLFMFNPNRICFKSDNSSLCLNNVKHVNLKQLLDEWYYFEIVCDDEELYTIIVDRYAS